MIAVITIRGADKSGALAQLTVFFSRKRYGLMGHQMAQSESGEKLLKFKVDAIRIDNQELAAEISSVSPSYVLVDVAYEGAESPADGTKKALEQMASEFPDIAARVLAYGGAFGPQARDRAMFDAGRKIGAFHYRKEWSFGSPLKMPVALKRSLVPALEKLAKVSATDTTVTILGSPLCGTGGGDNCCQFLAGFMQGFLDAGPGTKDTRVTKAACSAKGAPHCEYTIG